jgi:hypothetical protein
MLTCSNYKLLGFLKKNYKLLVKFSLEKLHGRGFFTPYNIFFKLANILKKEESIRNIKSSNESKTLFELMVQNGAE